MKLKACMFFLMVVLAVLSTDSALAFGLNAQDSKPVPVEEAFAPLIKSGNLVRVFHFNVQNGTWEFFDPQEAWREASNFTHVKSGDFILVGVTRSTFVELNGKPRTFPCPKHFQKKGKACWRGVVF
jgi:hypothetical protein